jgi:hypothetical protein
VDLARTKNFWLTPKHPRLSLCVPKKQRFFNYIPTHWMHSFEANLRAASRFHKSIATCLLCKLKKLYDRLDPFEQVYRPAVFFWQNFTSSKPPKKKASATHTKDVFGGEKWPKVARSRRIGFGNRSHFRQ